MVQRNNNDGVVRKLMEYPRQPVSTPNSETQLHVLYLYIQPWGRKVCPDRLSDVSDESDPN